MHQQTWAAQDSERWNKVLGRMCILPASAALSGQSMDAMAEAMQEWFDSEMARLEKEGRPRWGDVVKDDADDSKPQDGDDDDTGNDGAGSGAAAGGRKRRGSRSGESQ